MVPAINIWSMRVCRTKLLVARNSKKVSLVQRARHFQTWMSSVSKLQLSPTMLVLVRCKNSRTGLHCWSSFQWKSNWGHESSCWMCLVRFDLWYNSSYLNMWLFLGGWIISYSSIISSGCPDLERFRVTPPTPAVSKTGRRERTQHEKGMGWR